MDTHPKPLTLLLSVENLTVNKLMSSLPLTTLSSLPLEPSRLDLPIKMLPPLSPRFAKLTVFNQFKVSFPTKPRNIWLTETRLSSILKPQNKESRTGNSLQEMLSHLMFSLPPEKVWEKNLRLEPLSIKEKWMYNIPLNPSTLELSSLSSTKSTQLFHSPSEDSMTWPVLKSVSENAWSTVSLWTIQSSKRRLENSLPNSKPLLLFNQNPLPYCAEEKLFSELTDSFPIKNLMPILLLSLPANYGKRRRKRRLPKNERCF